MRAADSWLVEDGRVRGWDLHWARFATAAGVDVSGLEREVRRELPRDGRWFPRVECADDGALSWQLREAPERLPTVECRPEPVPDFRDSPRVKGPDLERLVALRGSGEALLAGEDGVVREGCLTSLLWWEDDVLFVVDDELPILDGVTRRLLIGLAEAGGVVVSRRRAGVDDLRGREVWLTSALHGIRAVTGWAGEARRAEGWQRRLESLAVPL